MVSETSHSLAMGVYPHYVSTQAGQLRVWRAGSGPNLVVLPGLVMSAAITARAMAQAHPGWTLTVIELPGIGGSARIKPESSAQIAAVIHEGLTGLGIGECALLAHDLSAPIAQALARCLHLSTHSSTRLLLLGGQEAHQWMGQALADLQARPDGTHLCALWAHFRDRAMLDLADPTRVGRQGSPLPSPEELDTAVVAAAIRPDAYSALWSCCAASLDAAPGDADIAESAELNIQLALWAPTISPATKMPARLEGTGLRCEYLQTTMGSVHMRRAGSGGRTLLMFHSAPGSAEPLEGLIQGLAQGREVIVCDYLGNGDSDKAKGDITIAVLAQHAHAIVDALDLEVVDLFGTHTGAMVAIEFSILWPERIGRMVLEAPVLLDPAFSAEILDNYLPPLVPDRWGTHLLRAWNMRRDMFLFWPWYRQTRQAVRSLGMPALQTLHDWTVGFLQSGCTYHLSYSAAFAYNTQARLPLITRPAMICAGPTDMLIEGLELAKALAPAGTVVTATPATVWYPGQSAEAVAASIAIYDDFLRRD